MNINDSELRRRGIRLTPQRRMILSAIAGTEGHITAEEIHRRIARTYPDINLSTVYRNLERLLDLRLVTVTDMGGGCVCYEAASPRHHHLICHRCGAVLELDDGLVDDLRRRVMERYDFETAIDHLALWGFCRRCREGGNTNGHAGG